MAEHAPTVLVVDDDDEVREIASASIESYGYRVIEASDGRQALEILKAEPGIRLLFTDVIMPGMDGFVLAHEAKRLRPDLKVVYTSGYLQNVPWGEHGIGYGPLLNKPWDVSNLRAVFQKVFGPDQPTC